MRRGEIKVHQEFRQRCCSSHPWQLPLLDEGQGGWIMKKLAFRIRKAFFETNQNNPRTYPRNFIDQELINHHREDCEACLLGRCPHYRRPHDPNMRRGREGNNINNLEDIKWVLLDENNHEFEL